MQSFSIPVILKFKTLPKVQNFAAGWNRTGPSVGARAID
jgi:hypothetical protein